MPISGRLIDQILSDLKRTCGGVRNDHFGLLYLEQEHGVLVHPARPWSEPDWVNAESLRRRAACKPRSNPLPVEVPT
jgi:hypothetical protein